MSAISATSVEAPSALYIPPTADTAFRERTVSPTTPTYSSKGSAIPRPSFPRASTDSRPDINGSPRLNGTPPVNGTPPIKPRSRTNSQPYSFDPSHSTNRSIDAKPYTNGISSVNPPESPHSPSSYNGRASDVRPTRIPKVALGRNASVSSHRHFPSSSLVSDSRNGYSLSSLTPSEPSHDSRMAEETSYSNYSRSIVSVGSQQQSRLLHELPPFQAGSRSSATHSFDHSEEDDAIIGRRSNDSDERPFEHWYRGEISRNGGVGELRVAKRQEMLDIANYGHTIRKITPHLLPRDLPPVDDMVRRRKRADSVTGIGDRESFYMDEQRAQEVGRVMDEGPLTDLDLDEDSDYSMSMRYDATAATVTAQSRLRNVTPTSLHSSSRQQSLPPTRIPGPVPSRQSSEPPRVPALPPTQRGASEPPSFPSTTSLPVSAMGPRSASQPLTQDQTTKRRAKSPAASTSASKRSKATALSIASKRAAENDKNRMSVACYPTPEDGVDVVNAIPSWTQPIPHLGNWDEVRISYVGYRLHHSHPWRRRSFCLL